MADLERIKKKYDTPEIDIEEATNGGNRYSLPYGLCKSVGINTEGMTPREAWESWQNKTGKTKAEAEKEHWGKTANEKQPAEKEEKSTTYSAQKGDTITSGGMKLKIVDVSADGEKILAEILEGKSPSGLRKPGDKILFHKNSPLAKQAQKYTENNEQVDEEEQTAAEQNVSKENAGKQDAPALKNSPAQEATNAGRAYSSTRKGVSEDWAARAQEMRSFSSYQQGSATSSYNASVDQFDKNVNELIQRYGNNATLTDKDWEEVYSIADRYAPNLEKYTDETNRNEASYPSWFISGPARYNVKKNEALMSRSRALYENNADRINPDDNVYLKKIKSILTNASIKSNDDAATAKLQDKYDKLKAELENGKAMNAYFRKYGTIKGFPGVSDKTAQEFLEAREREPYFNKQPYAAYHMTNVNAELRRIQARIDTLNKAKAQAEAAKANPQAAVDSAAANYPKLDGVQVQENADEMRIQLRFDDIPPAETREKLKRNGFLWSPSQKAWQRLLNENGKYAAKSVLKDLGGK
nr:MAG TPA: hypothetical protein [Caudoviricetes sp.]